MENENGYIIADKDEKIRELKAFIDEQGQKFSNLLKENREL